MTEAEWEALMNAQVRASMRIDEMTYDIQEHKRAIESIKDRIHVMEDATQRACDLLWPKKSKPWSEKNLAKCLRRHARKERRRAGK